jgi:5-methylcytosine-specific restriction endonuclease McrA
VKLKKDDLADSKRIKQRDGYVCQRCGRQPDPRGLHVHHRFRRTITSLRHEDDNLVTLCYGCHMWAHSNPFDAHVLWSKQLGERRYDELSRVAHEWRDR